MMNDPRFLRAPTILAAFHQAGQQVAAITHQRQVAPALGPRLARHQFFPSKRRTKPSSPPTASPTVLDLVGRKNPGIYDPEASVYCIEAGARLLERHDLDLLYLSTTDFVQHKWAPGEPEANAFYARLDRFIGALDAQDIILGITADHGMNAKTTRRCPQGAVYRNPTRRRRYRRSEGHPAHHRSLCRPPRRTGLLRHRLSRRRAHPHEPPPSSAPFPASNRCLSRAQAAATYQLPPDRIGELVVLADQDTVLGRTPGLARARRRRRGPALARRSARRRGAQDLQ